MLQLIPIEYEVRQDGRKLELSIVQRSEGRWAIRSDKGFVMNRDYEWEYEPFSSERTEDFLKRCRYTLDEAYEHLENLEKVQSSVR